MYNPLNCSLWELLIKPDDMDYENSYIDDQSSTREAIHIINAFLLIKATTGVQRIN